MKKKLPLAIMFISSVVVFSSCTSQSLLQKENSREIASEKQKIFANLFGNNDKGFRYNEKLRQCLNPKSTIGFNPKFFGECGDLTQVKIKKLKKFDFTNLSLRGVQLSGLDLSGFNFSGTDLTGANLRGTNLKDVRLDKTILTNAIFNDSTILPFNTEEAIKVGMIKDGLPQTSGGSNDNHEYSDLLTTTNIEATKAEFRTFYAPTERYHSKLINLVKKTESIDLKHFLLILDVCYFNSEKIKKIQTDLEKPDLKPNEQERLIKELESARLIGDFNNQIIIQGIKKISDLSFEGMIQILGKIITQTENAALTTNTSFEHFEKNIEIKTKEQIQEVIKVTNDIEAYRYGAAYAFRLFNEYSEKKVSDIISINGQLKSYAKDYFIESALAELSSILSSDLILLADSSHSEKSKIRAKFIKLVSDLNIENIKLIIAACTYYDRDSVLLHFVNVVKPKLTTIELISLSDLAYDQKDEILKNYFILLSDINLKNVLLIAGKATYYDKDTIIYTYIQKYTQKLSTEDLIALSKAAYDKKDEILKDFLAELSDFSIDNAIKIASIATYYDKDTITLAFLKNVADKSIETVKMIELSRAAYDKKAFIILSYNAKISDLNTNNIVLLSDQVSYYDKDTLILSYIAGLKSPITSNELILLSSKSYDKKAQIILNNWSKVSDITSANIIRMNQLLSYYDKDTLIVGYIAKLTTLSTEELMKLSDQAYDKKAQIITDNLNKLSDYNFSNIVSLIKKLSYAPRDTVIQHFLSKQTSIKTDELLMLASLGYYLTESAIMSSYQIISDWSVENTIKITGKVSSDKKDKIVEKFLQTSPRLTTAQLIQLSTNCYYNTEKVLISYLNLVSDLTVNNAIILVGKISGSSKDTFLLNAVMIVSDLNKDNLMTLANLAYYQKDAVIKKGLERLVH